MKNCCNPAWLFFILCFTSSVQAQIASYEIFQIQGTELFSPMVGESVVCERNVVTAVGNYFFFLQTPDNRADLDQMTSNGIFVYTGIRPTVEVGDLVSLEGIVQEWSEMTRLLADNSSIAILDRDQKLPQAVCLSNDFPAKAPKLLPDLERVEGMRICLQDALVCSPADNRQRFYLTAANRPFREPGIEFPGDANLPVWDGNPELFYCDPAGLLSAMTDFVNLPAGSRMDAIGFFFVDDGFYEFWPQSYQLANTIPQTRGIRSMAADEISISSFNMEVFSDDESVYPIQLKKAARYIVELMRTPDVVALQEVENLKVVNQLIVEINKLSPETEYRPEIFVANSFINTAYLLSPAVKEVRVRALGESQRLSNGRRMHDRPPLLLEAVVYTENESIPFKIFNLHLRSLIGIEGRDASEVRLKRHEAAISVARMIHSIKGPNLFVTGDFNAYPFSDGYVDVLAQITGQNSLGAEYPVRNIVNPVLRNLTYEDLPESERYSYIYRGNAQMLDHLLASDLDRMELNALAYIRGNADNAEAYKSVKDVLFRVSDHDAIVAILDLPGPINREAKAPSTPAALSIRYPNPFLPSDLIRIELPEEEKIEIRLFTVDGKLVDFIQQGRVGPGIYTYALRGNLPFGIYVLEIQGEAYHKTEKIIMGNE